MADSANVRYDLFIGPLLVGMLMDTVIFGLCFMMGARYVLLEFNDRWSIKLMLIWVFLLNIFQICSETSMMWHYTVANFINPSALSSFPWQYSAIPLFSSLVNLPIQLYLARRVLQLAGSVIPAAIIAIVSVAQAALGILTSARYLTDSSLSEPLVTTKISLIVAACSTAAICLVLGFCILTRQPMQVRDENSWGSTLGYYAFVFAASGGPSAVLSIIELITFFKKSGTNVHIAFALPIARLYTVALLANLNERKQSRTQSDTSTHRRGISLGDLSKSRRETKAPVHITIQQDVDIQMESGDSDKAKLFDSPTTPGSGYSYGKSQPMGLGY